MEIISLDVDNPDDNIIINKISKDFNNSNEKIPNEEIRKKFLESLSEDKFN